MTRLIFDERWHGADDVRTAPFMCLFNITLTFKTCRMKLLCDNLNAKQWRRREKQPRNESSSSDKRGNDKRGKNESEMKRLKEID